MSSVTRKEYDGLKQQVAAIEKKLKIGSKIDRKPRKPSEFNLFVGSEIKKVKAEFPKMEHKLAFSKAVERWKTHKK